MSSHRVKLDHRRRSVSVDGRRSILQDRHWHVLEVLVERAPALVSRAELIDTLWQGNYTTGDKGLNQAIWAIRAALSDDARTPRFIRSRPRRGYAWIGAELVAPSVAAASPARRIAKVAATAALGVIGVTAGYGVLHATEDGADPGVATSTYLVERDVHVEFASGCLGILENRDDAKIGTPVLSADGTRVALTVWREDGCRLVTVELSSGDRQEYDACPSDTI